MALNSVTKNRHRKRRLTKTESSNSSASPKSAHCADAVESKSLIKSTLINTNTATKRESKHESRTACSDNLESSTSFHTSRSGDLKSCWDFTGMNFMLLTLGIWALIMTTVWYPELKDSAVDYYYLQYPQQQPLSSMPDTIMPLFPSVWVYDPDKNTRKSNETNGVTARLKGEVQQHLRDHWQPHYYMLPQDFFDQQPHSSNTEGSNTELEAPPIRGVLIVFHKCDQSGLHFFQLPESRIVAAHALRRGLAIFSPSASSASSLFAKANKDNFEQLSETAGKQPRGEKTCWSASLDGDQLLGPLLYEWVQELEVASLPRMAIGIANGANLIVDSLLYKSLGLHAVALYGSHHPVGFNTAHLERDAVPPTAFVIFPKNIKSTELALKQFSRLRQLENEGKLRNEEEKAELQKERLREHGNKFNSAESQDHTEPKTSFRKTQLYSIEPHYWTSAMCQTRLPEYHTHCRTFFRHIATYQRKKQRKAGNREMKQDPQERIKRMRLGGLRSARHKAQLISTKGEVLQSSKSPSWNPVMESLGLDGWSTHIMAVSLKSLRMNKKVGKKHLMRFPTAATPEGRSWLWASMLQEIEVAYGMQDITSEFSLDVLDFLMYHAGLSVGASTAIQNNQRN